jgi:hypothetical protein
MRLDAQVDESVLLNPISPSLERIDTVRIGPLAFVANRTTSRPCTSISSISIVGSGRRRAGKDIVLRVNAARRTME